MLWKLVADSRRISGLDTWHLERTEHSSDDLETCLESLRKLEAVQKESARLVGVDSLRPLVPVLVEGGSELSLGRATYLDIDSRIWSPARLRHSERDHNYEVLDYESEEERIGIILNLDHKPDPESFIERSVEQARRTQASFDGDVTDLKSKILQLGHAGSIESVSGFPTAVEQVFEQLTLAKYEAWEGYFRKIMLFDRYLARRLSTAPGLLRIYRWARDRWRVRQIVHDYTSRSRDQ